MAEQAGKQVRNKGHAWLGLFLPRPNTASRTEQVRAGAGALLGLLVTALLTPFVVRALVADSSAMAFLIAPMGASAVLLFGVPASPLAQPWSVFGGNVVSAIVGVTVARLVGDPVLAAPMAAGAAIVCMFLLRCLHPPGGAVALTAVLAGPAVHAAGYQFAFVQVALNSALMVLAALAYNNLTGRRYPHSQQSGLQPAHATGDPVPTSRVGFAPADLDAVLQRYGQVLDVSRDDLENIILATEMQAYERRFGVITCGAIMSKDAVTVEFGSTLLEAWQLLRQHRLHALPVLNKARRVIGVVAQSDFLRHGELDHYSDFGARLRRFLMPYDGSHSDKPEVVGQIMTARPLTARTGTPIVELVPLMANSGLHHIPVIDGEDRFAGMVSQSDLLAALYESRLNEPTPLASTAY
jgi:CBS domain-containing membrane protein